MPAKTRRGLFYAAGAVFVATSATVVAWLVCVLSPVAAPIGPAAALARSAASPADAADPLALIAEGAKRYQTSIRDYRCLLSKQELLADGLTPVQDVELRVRRSPLSIYMLWKTNAADARRALFLGDDPKHKNKDGEPLVRVEPNGSVARLFVRDTFVLAHGPEAQRSSRRTIDEAGFGPTFELFERSTERAQAAGVLDIRYGGTGVVDGRPTYVIIRDLPYTGPECEWPEARLVLHLDREWLLPVAIYTYADHEERELLGSYVFTGVELNVGLTAKDFEF